MNVPILITCFSRPIHLNRVMGELSGLPNPIYIAIDGPNKFDVKYKDYAKPSLDNKNACITKFKPTVISSIEFSADGQRELIKSVQSGDNEQGNLMPYYFTFNGYSCTNAGFVLKFTYVGLDANDDQIQMVNLKESTTKGGIQNLLKSATVTGIVYMNPNGIDVNTPTRIASQSGSGYVFVDHTGPC